MTSGEGAGRLPSQHLHLRLHFHADADSGTRALALRWLAGFVGLAREALMPLAAPILAAVLPCVAHHAPDIAQVRCPKVLTSSVLLAHWRGLLNLG